MRSRALIFRRSAMEVDLISGSRGHSSSPAAFLSPTVSDHTREPPPPPAPEPTNSAMADNDELALASLSLSCRREELEARLRGADRDSSYILGSNAAYLRRRAAYGHAAAASVTVAPSHSSTQHLLATSHHSLDFDLDVPTGAETRNSRHLEVPAIRRQKSAEYYRQTSYEGLDFKQQTSLGSRTASRPFDFLPPEAGGGYVDHPQERAKQSQCRQNMLVPTTSTDHSDITATSDLVRRQASCRADFYPAGLATDAILFCSRRLDETSRRAGCEIVESLFRFHEVTVFTMHFLFFLR